MARKPAPIQITWLYSASTTGLGAIDYRISDPYIDPLEEDDSCYSERTVRLPETAWCYDPLLESLPVKPVPAVHKGYATFGSLGRLLKTNHAVVAAWSKVLEAVPESQLCLLAPDGHSRRRMADAFASEHIDPARIRFVSRRPRREYLQAYDQIDIALDTFPYNGHTTSLDALWMGVPVVTLAHRRPVGRVGVSLLGNLGVPELVAQTPEQYVQIAADLAHDVPRLTHLRSTLRQRMEQSPLMDAPKFARSIEAAYRQMWQTWCATAAKS
jgi:predicted O-linked N-acetylglucosamine transferase (SPINDLY family)